MQIINRSDITEDFNLNKIELVLNSAFNDTKEKIKKYQFKKLLKLISASVYDGITVEEIQDLVENELINGGFKETAKAFIIYRYKHKEDRQIEEKINFITNYSNAVNAASGSEFDSNANVENKNLATLMGEIPKESYIRLNRRLLTNRIKQMYDKETAQYYIYLLENHFIYKNDETSIANYCASITMYPWLLNGTKNIGGNSAPPTNLKSFCGGFVNLVFMVSSMLSGAVSAPEALTYMDFFIRKEYGDDYIKEINKVVDLSLKQRTIDKIITDCFEQIVYSINQPTGARNFQAVFFNISYFDKYYFESIFSDFIFPDGTKPKWETVSWLQKRFMKWFNKERLRSPMTFPVETMALLTENGEPKDKEYGDFTAQMYSEGHSFFTYLSDSPDSLSSCCRLRNEINTNEFSYTLGAGGVSTGSKSVLTLNLNRIIQTASNNNIPYMQSLEEAVDLVHKVQLAYNENLKEFQSRKLLPLFDAGYINIDRQYLTIGVNGLVEAAEFLGIEISDNKQYTDFVQEILGLIEKYNKKYKVEHKVMFNCEMIPAENVGVKFAKWDKKAGLKVNRDCYNSYFYIVEDKKLNIVDKIKLHGKKYIQHLTGGSALHLNLEEHLSFAQYKILLNAAIKEGCNYLTFNVPNTVCNDCGYISKNKTNKCLKCGSENLDYLTRIIGYLKRISSFSKERQIEAKERFYHKLQ